MYVICKLNYKDVLWGEKLTLFYFWLNDSIKIFEEDLNIQQTSPLFFKT